jgi:hypothetical protein
MPSKKTKVAKAAPADATTRSGSSRRSQASKEVSIPKKLALSPNNAKEAAKHDQSASKKRPFDHGEAPASNARVNSSTAGGQKANKSKEVEISMSDQENEQGHNQASGALNESELRTDAPPTVSDGLSKKQRKRAAKKARKEQEHLLSQSTAAESIDAKDEADSSEDERPRKETKEARGKEHAADANSDRVDGNVKKNKTMTEPFDAEALLAAAGVAFERCKADPRDGGCWWVRHRGPQETVLFRRARQLDRAPHARRSNRRIRCPGPGDRCR